MVSSEASGNKLSRLNMMVILSFIFMIYPDNLIIIGGSLLWMIVYEDEFIGSVGVAVFFAYSDGYPLNCRIFP